MLHELLLRIDLTQVLLFAITTIGGALLMWYRKRISEWKSFWRSVLNGLRAVPELEASVKGIQYYVAPNGGGSLMDSVRRIEVVVDALTEQVNLVIQTMRAENDSDDYLGRFYCDSDGAVTYVNQTYARWLGVGKDELMGWDYLNFVHSDDVDRVRHHWEVCRDERRQYHLRYRMIAANNDVIEVEVAATPIPEDTLPKRWIGTIRRLDHDRRKAAKTN